MRALKGLSRNFVSVICHTDKIKNKKYNFYFKKDYKGCDCKSMKNCRYKCAALIFLGGVFTECFTFYYTKDIKKSTGLGWGFLGVILIL